MRILLLCMVLIWFLTAPCLAKLSTDTASSLVETNQGILPDSQPQEIIGINLGLAAGETGTLNSVTVTFEDVSGKGTFTISDLSRVSIYQDTSTIDTPSKKRNGIFNLGEDTEIGFVSNPTSLTVTITVNQALSIGDEDNLKGNDFFVAIKTSPTISGGPIYTDDDRRDDFTAKIDKGGVSVTVTGGITSEAELKTTGTITCEGYSIDLTPVIARDYYPAPDSSIYPYSVPDQDVRPRWDIEPQSTQEVFTRVTYSQILPLEIPTQVIGISLSGGTTNNQEYLDSIKIKLQNIGSDTAFDPREGLDSNRIRSEVISGIWTSFFGIDIYEDLDSDGSLKINPDSVVRALDTIGNYIDKNNITGGPDGPWTITFTRTGTQDEAIETKIDSLVDYIVVIRADSGYSDDSGIIGDDNPIKYGADFQVELGTNSIGLRNGGGVPTSSSGTLKLTTKAIYPVLELHDLAGYVKIIDATSPPIPIIGINLTDTYATSTVSISDEVIQNIRINFDFSVTEGTVTTGDFASLTTDENSGVSLWKDNKTSGDIGVFDSNDTLVSISSPQWQQDGTLYYIILDPVASQEMPGDDTYTGSNRGDDYFICVRTSDTIRYRDKFPGNVSIKDEDIQFRTQKSAQGTGITISPFSGTDLIEGETVSTSGVNIPVFLTDLTEENQTIPIPGTGETGTQTAVLGINLIGDTTNNPQVEEAVIEFYSKGNDKDFDPGLDLEPLSVLDTSGVALYKDSEAGQDGVFDSSDTFITPTTTPEFIGQTGEPFQVRLSFSNNKQFIPQDDTTGGNIGPDYFVVIRLSERANPGDDFSVGIIGWAGDQLQVGLKFRDNQNRLTRTYERIQTNSINTIPQSPAGLDVTSGTSSVTLSWDANTESDLDGYNIYRKGLTETTDKYTKLNTTLLTTTNYTDTPAGTDGEKFIYAVTSQDKVGNESERSETVVVIANEEGGGKGGGGGGCFIASASFGSPYSDEVIVLSKFRDEYLLPNSIGRLFVKWYYRFSPPIADYISKREYMKRIVRTCLKPVVGGLSQLGTVSFTERSEAVGQASRLSECACPPKKDSNESFNPD